MYPRKQTFRCIYKRKRSITRCCCCPTNTARPCSRCLTSCSGCRPGVTWTRCPPATWPCVWRRRCSTSGTPAPGRRRTHTVAPAAGQRRPARSRRTTVRRPCLHAGTIISRLHPPPPSSVCPIPSSWDRTRRLTTACCFSSNTTVNCSPYVNTFQRYANNRNLKIS